MTKQQLQKKIEETELQSKQFLANANLFAGRVSVYKEMLEEMEIAD